MLEALAVLAQGLFGMTTQELRSQPVRQRLLALIRENPGRHASELCRGVGDPWSTVQYHLDLLAKSDLVQAVEAGRTRRFFPLGMDTRSARLLAILHEGRREEVARFILDHPGLRQVDVCREVDLSRKTFRSCVAPLVHEGLIAERRGLADNRYFPEPDLGRLLRD